MAQKLKDDIRNKLIVETKKELYLKGYKDASLRNIASNAGITVGNIYRYYKNKEELCNSIVSESYFKIKNSLNNFNINDVSIDTHVFGIKMDESELLIQFDNLYKTIIEVYEEDRVILQILLNTKLKDELVNLYKKTFTKLIEQNTNNFKFNIDISNLIDSYSEAIYVGIKMLLSVNKEAEELSRVLSAYTKSYIDIFNHDYNRFF